MARRGRTGQSWITLPSVGRQAPFIVSRQWGTTISIAPHERAALPANREGDQAASQERAAAREPWPVMNHGTHGSTRRAWKSCVLQGTAASSQ